MPKLQLPRHPQTAALLLCIHRSETNLPNPLPRLPPEMWELILQDYITTPHPIFGIPMPLLTRFPPNMLTPEEDEEYDDHDPDTQPIPTYTRTIWRHLPLRIRKRWLAHAKSGTHLHLMNNRLQIRASRTVGAHWPFNQWTSLSLLKAGQRFTAQYIAHRLRSRCIPDEEAQDIGHHLSYDLDDSDIWRVFALAMQDRNDPAPAIPARPGYSQPRTGRNSTAPRHRRTSRRLSNDPRWDTTNQLAYSTPLLPPLGISVRERFSPAMLRHLAKGLCPPDHQPPAELTTASELVHHIFQHSN